MRKFLLYLHTILLGTSITYFFIQNTSAEQRKTITIFNSGYFESLYNNKQIANFGIEFLENSNFVLERLKTTVEDEINSNFSKFIFISTINYLFDFQFLFAFFVSYHEFGHAMRLNSLGINHIFTKMRWKELTTNFFVYLTDGIFSNYSENLTSTVVFYEKLSPKDDLISSAGGLNNQMYFQEKAFDDVMYKNNKINNFYLTYSIFSNVNYYYGNITPVEKGSAGDIGQVLQLYEDLGINITKENFKDSIITSLLFSQFTYSSLYSLFSGKDSIKPLQYKGFIFPDVFPYITTRGISYRIKSAYRYNDDLIFRFGIEFIAYGKSTQEFIFGVNTKLTKDTRLDLLTVFGKDGVNIETTYTIPMSKHFNVNLDFDLHSTRSLYGERNAYRLYELKDLYINTRLSYNGTIIESKQYKIKRPMQYSYYFGLSLSYVF